LIAFFPNRIKVSKMEQRRESVVSGCRITAPSTASVQVKRNKTRDLEDMATKLLETARNLAPGPDRHAILEQIGTFRIKLVAIAAKRKLLQSANFSWRPSFAQTTPVRG
jgi:hypothetical protein